MSRRGRWLRRWQDYPAAFVGALTEAVREPYQVGFDTARAAQSFRVRMQKMQRGILADADAPGWMREAAETVAWTLPEEAAGVWYVTGGERKARYVDIDELEREMVEFNSRK